MTAPDSHSLYRKEILRLAMALPHNDQLAQPCYSATRRSAVCGSEMTVDVAMDGNVVTDVAIRAKACALGQASAAVLRTKAIGQEAVHIENLRDALKAALQTGSGELEWLELEPFRYASDFPARQPAILLPFDTLLAAMKQAGH